MKCDSDIYFDPASIFLPINYDLIPTLALLEREVRRSHDKNTIMMASPFLALLKRPKPIMQFQVEVQRMEPTLLSTIVYIRRGFAVVM
jgi:hypothetical protein